jgi:hypothetical protein
VDASCCTVVTDQVNFYSSPLVVVDCMLSEDRNRRQCFVFLREHVKASLVTWTRR